MSNNISIRRVIVQTINEQGEPIGNPSFGVLAADDYEQAYNDTFESLDELNKEIHRTGCILDIVAPEFEDVSREGIGTSNYYGPVKTLNYLDMYSYLLKDEVP